MILMVSRQVVKRKGYIIYWLKVTAVLMMFYPDVLQVHSGPSVSAPPGIPNLVSHKCGSWGLEICVVINSAGDSNTRSSLRNTLEPSRDNKVRWKTRVTRT